MPNPTASLARHVSWSCVLPQLGTPVDAHCLPATVRCPLCLNDRLQIFADQALGGEWVACDGCHFAGDVIELAARCWKTSIVTAVTLLRGRGLMLGDVTMARIDAEAYERDHVELRSRIARFWAAAQKRLPFGESAAVRDLQRKLGMYGFNGYETWQQSCAQFVGAASVREVEDALFPGSVCPQWRANHNGRHSRRRGSGPGLRRLFRGLGWDQLLVLPYFDLPGRFRSFMLIGRNANGEAGDIIFKSLAIGPSNISIKEAGLQMLRNHFGPPNEHLGDTIFVITDPLVALHLQVKSVRVVTATMPIVGSFHDSSHATRCWANLPRRQRVFWGPAVDEDLLIQARQADGLVSLLRVSSSELQNSMGHHLPLHWLRLMRQWAVPWQRAVADELRRRSREEAAALLDKLQLTSEELYQVAPPHDRELADRLHDILESPLYQHQQQLGRTTLVESAKGWQIARTKELIVNARVRIEQVLRTENSGVKYRGYAQLDGKRFDFLEDAGEVHRRGLFACVRDCLLRDHQMLLDYRPNWNGNSLTVACRFHQPEPIEAVDAVGWHTESSRFVFPHFSIRLCGDVVQPPEDTVFEGELPCQDFDAPLSLSMPSFAGLMDDSTATQIFWAVAIAITHNVVAPVFGQAPRGIALVGAAAQSAGAVAARMLGCLRFDVPPRIPAGRAIEKIDEACHRHRWPVYIVPGARRTAGSWEGWLGDPQGKNCLMPLDAESAQLAAGVGNWIVVQADGFFTVYPSADEAGRQVLPHYLLDLCRRRLCLEAATDSLLERVAEDLAGWVERSGGDGSLVGRSASLLHHGRGNLYERRSVTRG